MKNFISKTGLFIAVFAASISYANTAVTVSCSASGMVNGYVKTGTNQTVFTGSFPMTMNFPATMQANQTASFNLNAELLSDAYTPITYNFNNAAKQSCEFIFAFYNGNVNVKANPINGAVCSVSIEQNKLMLNVGTA